MYFYLLKKHKAGQPTILSHKNFPKKQLAGLKTRVSSGKFEKLISCFGIYVNIPEILNPSPKRPNYGQGSHEKHLQLTLLCSPCPTSYNT